VTVADAGTSEVALHPRFEPKDARDDRPAVLDVEDLWVVHPRRRLSVRPGAVRADDVAAVRGISFTVPASGIVGIVGESGSGKSSAALAVTRLGRITSGTVLLEGTDLIALGRSALRRMRPQIQMIFQDPNGSLDPRQRMRAGLAELRRQHRERTGWISDEDLLERVGLSPAILPRLPSELSGGQAQRMVIARALLLRPALLVADEPTSALDVSIQAQILNLLLSLSAEEKIGILLITHDLPVARHVADYVYVMEHGVFVEHGESDRVFSSPTHDYTQELINALPSKEFRPGSSVDH
jgi:ABC-type oligopeptide transport system ATPase subunit